MKSTSLVPSLSYIGLPDSTRKHRFLSNQWTMESGDDFAGSWRLLSAEAEDPPARCRPVVGQRGSNGYAEAFLVARKVSRAAMLLASQISPEVMSWRTWLTGTRTTSISSVSSATRRLGVSWVAR